MRVRTVSLFSGAGGLDFGAIMAGAEIVWANDMMKEACETYKANIGLHIVQGDLNEHIEDIKNLSNVDLVIGGPPCQGFSVAGKMDADDERSKLIWKYVDVVSLLKPRAFVMENVKALGEIARWKDVRNKLLSRFKELGYSVNYIVLNACDFDVPQSRERVFFVGFKSEECKDLDLVQMTSKYAKKAKTVREALRVLDKAGTGNNSNVCRAKVTLAAKPILRKSPYAGMLFNGMGRPTRIDGYSATLPASMGGNKTPIIDEKELYDGATPWILDYHKKVSSNSGFAEFKPAPSFMRRMTIAEAAVLQTFPLEYKFSGSQSKIYTQIGNAVPCNLARAIVKMVIDVLTKKEPILYKDKQKTIFDYEY